VRVLDGRQARPQVDELPDPGLTDEEVHDSAGEGARAPEEVDHLGHGRLHGAGRGAVGGEVVDAAEERVVHAGDARPLDVDAGRGPLGFGADGHVGPL
jgi:hypothetical protein